MLQADQVQGTMRTHPEAFLAPNVVVCEGASEVGLLRGIDRFLVSTGLSDSITAKGTALVDAGGVTRLYERAKAFLALGYRVLAFRDDDQQPDGATEASFLGKWRQAGEVATGPGGGG